MSIVVNGNYNKYIFASHFCSNSKRKKSTKAFLWHTAVLTSFLYFNAKLCNTKYSVTNWHYILKNYNIYETYRKNKKSWGFTCCYQLQVYLQEKASTKSWFLNIISVQIVCELIINAVKQNWLKGRVPPKNTILRSIHNKWHTPSKWFICEYSLHVLGPDSLGEWSKFRNNTSMHIKSVFLSI